MPGGIHPPLSVIASWPHPNYVDPVTRGNGALVLCTFFGVIVAMAFGARLWARFVILRNAGIDDWLMIAALVPTIGLLVGICLSVRVFEFDRHVWDVPFDKLLNGRKMTWANEFLYVLSSGLIKLSILSFYRRLTAKAGTFSPAFVRAVWVTQATVVTYMVAFIFCLCFGCIPFSAIWNELDPTWPGQGKYQCLDEGAALLSASIISVCQDFVTALLPFLLLHRLQISKHQKVAVGCVLATGVVVCFTGVVRIYYISECFYKTYDTTWYAHELWAWTAAEVALAVVCASSPALKVFLKRYLGESASVRVFVDSAQRSFGRLSRATTRSSEPRTTIDELERQRGVASMTPDETSGTDGEDYLLQKHVYPLGVKNSARAVVRS